MSVVHLLEELKGGDADVFFNRLNLTDEEISIVEQQTRDQSNSELWFELRAYRITSSIAHSFYTAKKLSDSLLSKIRGDPLPDYPPLVWGKSCEPIAKQKFLNYMKMHHSNAQLFDVGFTICKEFPFIGGSPDGLLTCACHQPALVEIKCPYRLRNKQFAETKLEYLDKNNNLKQTHTYFTQITIAMGSCKVPMCYFVVYGHCDKDLLIKKIDFDMQKWNDITFKLAKMYRNEILPRVLI